jgi:hypothetical protein
MKRPIGWVIVLLVGGALAYGCGNSSNGTGNNDAGGGKDVVAADVPGMVDAPHDAPPPEKDGPNPFGDSGEPDSSGGTCPTPANLGEWTPPAYVHAERTVGACSASDITGYYTACLSSTGTTADCMAFATANPACVACISTPLTSTTWGAIVTDDNVDHINVAGCLELTDPGAAACSKLIEEQTQCEVAACDKACVVMSGSAASFTQWQACVSTADGGECSMYATPASACAMAIDGGAAACTSATTFEAYFLAVVPIFCGGGDGGAGEAGAKDASSG